MLPAGVCPHPKPEGYQPWRRRRFISVYVIVSVYTATFISLGLMDSFYLCVGHILIESPCLCLDAIQRRYLITGVGTSRSRRESIVGDVSDSVSGGRQWDDDTGRRIVGGVHDGGWWKSTAEAEVKLYGKRRRWSEELGIFRVNFFG